MASLRSKADCDLTSPLFPGRVISPDELVEVDDDVFLAHAWPEDTWAVVDAPDDPRTVADLKAELEAKGLPTTGRKTDLIKRLDEADAAPVEQPAPVISENTGE